MAAAKAGKTEDARIVIPAIDVQNLMVHVVGTSPLIVHAWSQKAKQEILDKQMKKATKAKTAKNPVADVVDSLYWLVGKPDKPYDDLTEEDFATAIQNGARFGFPSTAFKAAAVAAAYRAGITKNMVMMNGALHIDGEYTEIHGVPTPREDMVKIAMGTADIRYRGEFKEWSADILIKYNAGVLSKEQVVNAINLGGFACGIGEWRPERGGENGMFKVANA